MCEHGNETTIHVIRRNNPHVVDGWHEIKVDACISTYVQTMNNLGIITLGCCCGHGEEDASVLVAYESIGLMREHGYQFDDYNGYELIHWLGGSR